MTGVAALAICAAFTSCSKSEELYNPEAISGMNKEKVIENYNARFLAYVGGSIAPDQDWGFGSAGTREENANANEWADPNKEYGGLLVPPAITPTQAAVVKTYFQTHDKLGYKDPEWSNYFIQQVYKGHTSVPENCATPEEYTALNGTTKLIASDYMDHLAAIDGSFFDHINNFNHGDCGENDHVLDNGGNANDGPFHTDKIMYMKESTTKSFGYFNSNGSICHTKYTALVGWKTIHDWAVDNYPNYDGCLNDTWNRSYMGFDFEQMIDDQCYATVAGDNSTVKTLTFSGEYYINGTLQTNYEYLYNGQPVKMLSDQTNRYCGELRTVTDEQLYSDERDANNNNAYLGKKLNTDVIDALLADGFLPIDNKSFREWAKVGGCADGYFSDWIVTLTEAKTDTPPTPPTRTYTLRVLAEDLTFANKPSISGVAITEADDGADFDFNDVVFDVAHVTGGTADENGTWIRLMAAGGTLPLYIGSVAEENEVHHMFNVSESTMVNTYHGRHSEKTPVEYKYSNSIVSAKAIPIIVIKDGITFTLSAERGEPASKIAVDLKAKPNFEWADERQSIKVRYPMFAKWAMEGQTVISEWWD